MISLAHVRKAFGDVVAVDDVSLSVARAETVALIGPSGSGKSTVLSIVVGLVVPDQGTVTVNDLPLDPASARFLRRRMGYVIQDGGLFPHLTARDNVALMAREVGWPRKERAARLDELCRLTRFPEEALSRYPAELSGGQRQRVSLMRALMLDPDILLMDEPLGSLDPMIRAELQDDLKMIFRTLAKTVVIVTHDLDEAAFFGDRIVLMNEGRIVQQGTVGDLVTRPAEPFVTQFVRAQRRSLGSAEMRPTAFQGQRP
jgi:osmoprotectant transport system ATP-binding protein